MTGFLSITFSSLDRLCTTQLFVVVSYLFVQSLSKIASFAPRSATQPPSCEGFLVPLRFRPFERPILWGRDCKGSNLFSSDQIRRKKSPVPETDSSSFASFATCAPPRLAEPLFLSCDCKGNNLFSSDQIFRENSFLFSEDSFLFTLTQADLLQI